jgi:D-glycero-D-manno-heptose 1,7-bisphosphate phosphatase
MSGLAESPLRVEDVRLLPGATGALKALAAAGFVLVCVSNQPAAAKGKASVNELLRVHETVMDTLSGQGVAFATSQICLHHPEGVMRDLTKRCACRKPAPGMLLTAAAELRLDLASSWMLGDADSDVAAGSAAGCRTVLLEYSGSVHKRRGVVGVDLVAPDIEGGVAQLLDRCRP